MTTIIDKIKSNRIDILSIDKKEEILIYVSTNLIYKDYCIIGGASHFIEQKWYNKNDIFKAPFKFHSAISEYLKTLGFKTERYYNKGGIDQGLKVYINN